MELEQSYLVSHNHCHYGLLVVAHLWGEMLPRLGVKASSVAGFRTGSGQTGFSQKRRAFPTFL